MAAPEKVLKRQRSYACSYRSLAACTSHYSRKTACFLWPRVYRHPLQTSRKTSHQSVYHIVLHKPPGEFVSQPFEPGLWSVPQGVLPIPDAADTEWVVPSVSSFVNCHYHFPFPRCSPGRRQFTTRSKTRALFSAASVGKGGETKPTQCKSNRSQRIGSLNSQRLKTQHAWRTCNERINFSWV
jgi:hypothetical protein